MSIGYKRDSSLPRVGMYLGIVGAVSLLVFVLIFQEDWLHRYPLMIVLIPIALIALLISRRLPLAGGSLLVALGITTLILDVLFNVGNPGQIAGRGLGYTVAFVTAPLLASGVFFIWGSRKG
jgi:hypothetical protein